MSGILPLLSTAVALAASQPADLPAPEEPPARTILLGSEGSRMTVPVTIAQAGPYRFVVDTGAERTVVSRQLATALGLPAGRAVRVTGMADVTRVGTVAIPSLSVAGIASPRIEAPMFEEAHLGAPGMLGIDTLQGHAVSIDFDRGEMAVARSDRRRPKPLAATGEIVVRARSLMGQLVVTDAFFGRTRVRVILDTGSAVTLGNLALRAKVQRAARAARPISLLSVSGASLDADYTQVREVRLGGITMAQVPIAFADAPPFRRFGLSRRPALLLGMDMLALFRQVRIDFANREIRFLMPRGTMRASPASTAALP